jgi:hypothetical protein
VDKVLRNGYRGPRPPQGGPGPYVRKPDPQGACAPVPTLATRTSLPAGEEVRCRHVPLGKRPLNQHRYVSGGSQLSVGSQPNYRIKMWVGEVRMLETGHGLPTVTLGRYADTTVSPPVTEAARRITTPRTQAGGV